MKFSKTSVAGNVEILAATPYKAVPVCITETDPVLAGTPVTAAGKAVAAGTGAMGILLYDVDPAANPNGAAVVEGIVDAKKVKAHANIDLPVAALKTAVPGVVIRDNVGVNE